MITLRIDPVDILFFRGNRLFDDSRAASASMPPQPSVIAGALRSDLLVRNDTVGAFLQRRLSGSLGALLGRGPGAWGDFRVAWTGLIAAQSDRNGAPTWLVPAPHDLVAFQRRDGALELERLEAEPLEALGVRGSFSTSHALVLRRKDAAKPLPTGWLTAQGMQRWLRGDCPEATQWRSSASLWAIDHRLGIGLDLDTGTVREGLLYTSAAVSLRSGVAFAAAVRTGDATADWHEHLVRLGGDGRAARLETWSPSPPLPMDRLPQDDRFTLLAVTPCVFAEGWLPTGCRRDAASNACLWRYGDFEARIVAVALPGYEVVSGWDLARGGPKPAQRMVPAGTVYYMERVRGDWSALQPIVEHGLWDAANTPPRNDIEAQRWAEGYNAVWFGTWH